ncbi:hypothetical protein D9M71_468330 [compost metagenome]
MKWSVISVNSWSEVFPKEREEFLLDQNGNILILDLGGGRDMPIDDFETKYGKYILQFFTEELPL